ncbi:MAG: hypothetical protein RLZZ565_124 [Planctomycetota bacterium]
MGNNEESGSEGRRVARSVRRGIEPMWDPSKAAAFAFEWCREGQLEPMLEEVQSEQGTAAVWAFGIACLDPLRGLHHLLPKLIDEASHGFTDPARRRRVRRSFAGAAGGASAIGLKHGLPDAAAFLAGFHLLEERPLRAVAKACAHARLAAAFLERNRVLEAFPSRRSLRKHSPPGTDTRRLQAEALSRLISIDPRTAEHLLGRVNRVGGERTRLVIGHLAQVEAEAIAWLAQTTRLEAMLEQEGGFQ